MVVVRVLYARHSEISDEIDEAVGWGENARGRVHRTEGIENRTSNMRLQTENVRPEQGPLSKDRTATCIYMVGHAPHLVPCTHSLCQCCNLGRVLRVGHWVSRLELHRGHMGVIGDDDARSAGL